MNYFDLYDFDISFKIDPAILKRKFYELSRKYHPDFYSQSTNTEQEDALTTSADINKAFKIFSQEYETIKYVLQLKGFLEEEEKYQLSPNFLMEMMDFSEQAMEAKMDNDELVIDTLRKQILSIENTIYEPVKTIVETYKERVTPQEALLQVKEYYFQKKYINRILAGLA